MNGSRECTQDSRGVGFQGPRFVPCPTSHLCSDRHPLIKKECEDASKRDRKRRKLASQSLTDRTATQLPAGAALQRDRSCTFATTGNMSAAFCGVLCGFSLYHFLPVCPFVDQATVLRPSQSTHALLVASFGMTVSLSHISPSSLFLNF